MWSWVLLKLIFRDVPEGISREHNLKSSNLYNFITHTHTLAIARSSIARRSLYLEKQNVAWGDNKIHITKKGAE